MGFTLVIKNVFKLLLAWAIGGAIILFAGIFFFTGVMKGIATGSGGLSAGIISIIIGSIGVLIIWYFSHKYDIKLTEGYRSRTRKFDY